MRRALVGVLLGGVVVAFACGDQIDTAPIGAETPDAALMDVAVTGDGDAGTIVIDSGGPSIDSGLCDSTMPFIGFQTLGTDVNSQLVEHNPKLTPDELTLFLARSTTTKSVILRHHRTARDQPWGEGTVIAQDLQNLRSSLWPGADGGYAYFDQLPPSSYWRILRGTLDGAGNPSAGIAVAGLGAAAAFHTLDPYPSPDESEFWFASTRHVQGDYDLFRAVSDGDGGFGNIEALDLNTTASERTPVISSDKRTLYFSTESGRASGTGIRMATRSSPSAPFGASTSVPGLEPLENEASGFLAAPGWISPDDCRLYLHTSYDGTIDVYVAWRR